MPSEKILEEKKAVVADLTNRLKNSVAGVVVSYKGITVDNDTKLRKDLREVGVRYSVVKNKLLSRAASEVGLSGMNDILKGTTAIATSEDDHVAAARILCKYAEANKNFTVKSGFLDGEIISLEKIISLSKLPTRDVLLGNVLGAFNAPIASFARAIQAIVDKGEDVAEEVIVEEAAAEETKSDETPVEETQTEETKSDETSVEETSAE